MSGDTPGERPSLSVGEAIDEVRDEIARVEWAIPGEEVSARREWCRKLRAIRAQVEREAAFVRAAKAILALKPALTEEADPSIGDCCTCRKVLAALGALALEREG